MATLAQSFLADLDELSDDEGLGAGAAGPAGDADDGMADAADDGAPPLSYDSLDAVAHLTSSERYNGILKQVRDALAVEDAQGGPLHGPRGSSKRQGGSVEDDPEYRLLVECNALAVDIDAEVAAVHGFLREKYRPKFPELESLVQHPVDYARVVAKLGNEADATRVDLEGLLPAAAIMVVIVTAATTDGLPLPPAAMEAVRSAGDLILDLDAAKRDVLRYVESRIGRTAPNLSAAVGPEVAAQLMGAAGGLGLLSRMPACNIQVLGSKKKALAGFSTATHRPHAGFLSTCALVAATPPALRPRATRLVAGKCALLARVDCYGEDPAGAAGAAMRAEMAKKIDKWQEPPPAKTVKPLPAPDCEPKKRRGGKRLRQAKERYGMSDMRKLANRMAFDAAGASDDSFVGEDTGMLGQGGAGGRLRLAVKDSGLGAKAARKQAQTKDRRFGSSGGTNGLASSVAFTPVQGIELINPSRVAEADAGGRSGTDSYFSELGAFSRVKRS